MSQVDTVIPSVLHCGPIPHELAAALFVAQGELGNVPRDAANDYYKSRYTTLANLLDTIRPALQHAKIGFAQVPRIEQDKAVLSTILFHSESGQQIEWLYPITPADGKGAPNPQALGSSITYARRYTLMAILGIASHDDDDDGNAASFSRPPQQQRTQQPPRPEQSPPAAQTSPQQAPAVVVLSDVLNRLGFGGQPAREAFCRWLSDIAPERHRKPGLTANDLTQESLAAAILVELRAMKAAGWKSEGIKHAVLTAMDRKEN